MGVGLSGTAGVKGMRADPAATAILDLLRFQGVVRP